MADVRSELAEALRDSAWWHQRLDIADVLQSVVERIAQKAAAEALRDAADYWDASTNHVCDAPAEFRARADAADH